MKYIDAEKLIKSVDNYREGAKAALNPIDGDADYYRGKIDACKDMQELIADHQKLPFPQSHWKPSEEQMDWLESAVKLSIDKPHIHGIIISLYEQLKRL